LQNLKIIASYLLTNNKIERIKIKIKIKTENRWGFKIDMRGSLLFSSFSNDTISVP
jgi:hypothetical protein